MQICCGTVDIRCVALLRLQSGKGTENGHNWRPIVTIFKLHGLGVLPFASHSLILQGFWASCWCTKVVVLWQVDVVFEEVDEIVLQDSELPFIAGRIAEPVQPNLLRMRELLAASKCNVVLVDGIDQVSPSSQNLFPCGKMFD